MQKRRIVGFKFNCDMKFCASLIACFFFLVFSTTNAKADENSESLQAQMTAFHQQIRALMLKATQVPYPNALVIAPLIKQKLSDTLKSMRTVSQIGQQQNLDYLKRTGKSNKKLAVIAQESKLLEVEAEATTNYLNFQDGSFATLATATEDLINGFERWRS
jgi:hypothetical protein